MTNAERSADRLESFIARPQRAVWVVSLPLMAGMMLHVGYHIADTAFVGRLGPHALAGQTIVAPLFFVMFALVNGLGSAITVLVSQAIGRRDLAEAERIGGTALGLGLITGLAYLAAGLALGPKLLHLLGARDAVAQAAWDYFSVIALVGPLFFVSGFLRFHLAGEGDTRTPMLVMLLATTVNVALDPVFIFVLDMGVRGAAVATGVAQTLALSVYIWILFVRRRNMVRIRARNLLPARATLQAVLRVGIPSAGSQAIMAVGAALINRAVAAYGETGLAAIGAAGRIDHVVGMPLLGLASGAVTVVGMFAGAGRVDLVRSTAAYVLRWGVLVASVIGLGAYLASEPVLRFFIDDPECVSIGKGYLRFMVAVYPMMGLGMVGGRLLLGLGYPGLSLAITAVRLLLVGTPVAWISTFVLHGPIEGIWWGILAGAVASTTATVLLLRRQVWSRDPTLRARGAGA